MNTELFTFFTFILADIFVRIFLNFWTRLQITAPNFQFRSGSASKFHVLTWQRKWLKTNTALLPQKRILRGRLNQKKVIFKVLYVLEFLRVCELFTKQRNIFSDRVVIVHFSVKQWLGSGRPG